MSTVAAASRVEQIQAMLGQLATGTVDTAPTGAPAQTSFADVLATSSAPAAAPAMPAGAAALAPDGATGFDAQIASAAASNGIDPALLKGLIRQESGFDPNARSAAGAAGLTQLMPGTAASLGVDPLDPAQAIEGGARYLRQQLDRFGGDPAMALAAYNAGPGAVARYGGVPPYAETQGYVQQVLGYADQYRQAQPAASIPQPLIA
jgi:soluble lytic murein transglycosylase-like protein